jgi:hypothetical protein
MNKSNLKSMKQLRLNPFLFVSEKTASNQLIRKIFHEFCFSYDQVGEWEVSQLEGQWHMRG